MIRTDCLTEGEILALTLGEMAESELGEVGKHLEVCPRCEQKVRTFDDLADPFIASLRQPASGRTWAQGKPPLPDRVQTSENQVVSSQPVAEERAGGSAPFDFLSPPRAQDEIGRLAHFRILKLLGQGGMGMVFRAEDSQLLRPVALKVMRPDLAKELSARQRFLREARAAAALKHDNIVTIYQVGQEGEVSYLAMEFLEGEPLDRLLARSPRLTLALTLLLGQDVTRGLAAAHDKGLIHRDIKPANIWLETASPRGISSRQRLHAKILDFGLARPVDQDVRLTSSGLIIGTPAYMSPEQARGAAVDCRSDLFSLGCVLYQVCAGRPPFQGETTIALLTALAIDEPPPLRQLNPTVPQALSDLVARLLNKNPAQRPASAHAVLQQLQAIERQALAPSETVAPGPDASTPGQAPVEAPRTQSLLRGIPAPTEAHALQTNRAHRPRWQWWKVLAALLLGLSFAGIIGFLSRPEEELPHPSGSPAASVEPEQRPLPLAKQVAALPANKQVDAVVLELRKRNPGFDSPVMPSIENGVVVGLNFRVDKVSDLEPVRALSGLRSLVCYSQVVPESPLWDLSPLKGLPLVQLTVHKTAVADLTPLKDMPLVWLNIEQTRVTDLTPLQAMPLKFLEFDLRAECDTAVLFTIKSLERINGRPAAEFLKDLGRKKP